MRLRRSLIHLFIIAAMASTVGLTLRVSAQTSRTARTKNNLAVMQEYRFASGQQALDIPFELSNNLIFVQVRVNNSEPHWFILDTGASYTLVKQSLAEQFGLKLEQKEREFEGQFFAKGVSLGLPGVELHKQTIVAAPTALLEPSLGRAVDGVLGYDLFKNFVVEIDYAAQRLNLYQPARYRSKNSGRAIPITIEGNTPFVRARVIQPENKSAIGKFMIDTGANGALNIFGSFDKAHHLSASSSRLLKSATVGASSERSARIGRVSKIQLGPFVIKSPVVSFGPLTVADSSDDIGDGEIGAELLRRFKVALDYTRRRIILEPNAHFSEAFEASFSGASIAAEGADYKTFKVKTVLEDSPAAEAGLRPGDIINAINGTPAAELTLEGLRKMFRQEGLEYLLSIRRGEETQEVRIKLRRLL